MIRSAISVLFFAGILVLIVGAQDGSFAFLGTARFWMIGLIVFLPLVVLIHMGQYVALYIQAHTSDVRCSPLQIFLMDHHNVDPRVVILNAIRLHYEGYDIPIDELTEHVRQGGDLNATANVMIGAKKAGTTLDWSKLCEFVRSGGDLPKTIEKDGVERFALSSG